MLIPCSEMSMIVTACYKKACLVSLIMDGSLPSLPLSYNPTHAKILGIFCSVYQELEEGFQVINQR